MHLVPMICPREEDLATFSQEIHKLSLKHCEIFKKGEFKHERLFRYLRILLLEKFPRMQKLLEIREVAIKLWKALPFPPPPPPSGPRMSMFFNLIGKLTMTFFTVKGQSWRVLKSCISCRLISREKILARKYYTWRKKQFLHWRKYLSWRMTLEKILQRGRCMSGKKNSITSGSGGKHSFPAKSPIPPTPHQCQMVGCSFCSSVARVLCSVVFLMFPCSCAPPVSYPASIACERQTFLLAHPRWGTFSAAMNEEERLPFAGY